MSINWSTKNCKPSEPADQSEAVVRETLMLIMGVAGIGAITEENWKELYARIHFMEEISGTYMNKDRKPCPFTPEDIKRWIGMTTNWGNDTRAKFLKRMAESFSNDINRTIRELK
jgi:hypothetical protein